MGQHLLLTIRLHGDAGGTARYHGTAQGALEWPPAPARVFQALVAGSARGNQLPAELVRALEWLERLPPPTIAAPPASPGGRVDLYVPNNDADSIEGPEEISKIRVKKTVQPMLVEGEVPLLYSWPVPNDATEVQAIMEAANSLYQLGRGVDVAWAVAEIADEDSLSQRLSAYAGTVHSPEPHAAGKALACPLPGSLASLVERHRAVKFRVEGAGKGAQVLFSNAPKPRFQGVTYERVRHRAIYELRDSEQDARTHAWPIRKVVELVEKLRDGAAERLRAGLPAHQAAIEQTLIGAKPNSPDAAPIGQRVRIVPLPSIGHAHADRAVRRVLVEVPSGAPLRAADVEWAFSGLEPADRETGVVEPFVLVRSDADEMLRHYTGPSWRWRTVTAVALPEPAARRRIAPSRQHEERKGAGERADEESRAVAAVHVALRHASVRARAVSARVQREPFEAKGARAEVFAPGTRFAKERLWHIELEFDRPVEGPLVIGDGRFLGLGVMAPVSAQRIIEAESKDDSAKTSGPIVASPTDRSGLIAFSVRGAVNDRDSVAVARALRRAVMARVQSKIGSGSLDRFFSGHDLNGDVARTEHANHIALQWDPGGHRLLVIAPHWLDKREPSWEERRAIELLEHATSDSFELRAGSAGRFALHRCPLAVEDPLTAAARSWISVTPYSVTRHSKSSSANQALLDDVLAECRRRKLPTVRVTVLATKGVPGRGLEGRVRLDFAVAVSGPMLLGRTRYLGGGLFAAVSE